MSPSERPSIFQPTNSNRTVLEGQGLRVLQRDTVSVRALGEVRPPARSWTKRASRRHGQTALEILVYIHCSQVVPKCNVLPATQDRDVWKS